MGNYGTKVDTALGAQEFGVDEPTDGGFTARLPIVFDEVIEPKELGIDDLQALARDCGSYKAAAQRIGASEAFVRQKVQGKKYSRK